jgi:hypothetical protein
MKFEYCGPNGLKLCSGNRIANRPTDAMGYKLCSGTVFSLKVIVTLTFHLVTPKSIGSLPNMDNHPMKFEHCGPNGT